MSQIGVEQIFNMQHGMNQFKYTMHNIGTQGFDNFVAVSTPHDGTKTNVARAKLTRGEVAYSKLNALNSLKHYII